MIKENISLKSYNTFGLNVKARYFVEIETVAQLQEVIQSAVFKSNPHLILGGGSNVLLTKDFEGIVLKISIKGKDIVEEDKQSVTIKIMAGENWHEVVLYSLKNNWSGIENLSLIPGQVGAAPMQNIGAYGVELEAVFKELEAVEIKSGKRRRFDKDSCNFGYRESIFKNTYKGQFIIVAVILQLKKSDESVNISYGAIQDILKRKGIEKPNAKDVSNAIIEIRQSKLPDPKELGNSGSFFKNPVIDRKNFEILKQQYPEIPGYEIDENSIKVPAGWLIEQCGWKGKKVGQTGAHKQQALVLVNYGNASGAEILQLSKDIQQSVREKFNIELSPEVNII